MISEVENLERMSVNKLLHPSKMSLYEYNQNNKSNFDYIKIDPIKSRHVHDDFEFDISIQTKKMKTNESRYFVYADLIL